MSSDFKTSNFIGIEMLPMFPDQKPNNVKFILHEDFTSCFPFKDDTFDFIHMRFCWSYFTFDQWRTIVLKEFIRLLKPGGWLEIADISIDGENLVKESAYQKNLDPMIPYQLPTILSSMPNLSSNVYYEVRKIPCGSWGGRVGQHHEEAITDILLKCTEYLSPKNSQNMVEQILKEFKEYRTYSYCHRTINNSLQFRPTLLLLFFTLVAAVGAVVARMESLCVFDNGFCVVDIVLVIFGGIDDAVAELIVDTGVGYLVRLWLVPSAQI
ncbi:7321_t:CDS:2 [Scutellospora calospora]|uniref:7321_t:CDS:1 n=1 Tax=Scutellospora calospora TaxID=85575 RepID=A0ACA9K181_9GLOM|nr:7321_t:CDS:2 [Scutellospora calospora]